MISASIFRERVVDPALFYLGLRSDAASDLVLGTALAESGLDAIAQNGGPALGFFQIEPATHDDLWTNFLRGEPEMHDKLSRIAAEWPTVAAQLATNALYAAAICRLIYYRRPEPLPAPGDVAGYAAYWKLHYNTPAGKGTPEHFIEAWNRLAGS